jgi:tRNA(fMet)-specific endonuclease VapC
VSGRYLLDTNIAIAILESKIDFRSRLGAEGFLNSIVLGELSFGAEKSNRVAENLERLRYLKTVFPVLACDAETSPYYGRIRNVLRGKGRPIPENDIWIAASALQHGLTLVTHDGHFGHVDDLLTEAW